MASITAKYLENDARAFFDSHPSDVQDQQRAVLRAARALDPATAEALTRQNARYLPSPARDAHLQALAEGAAAVVTGQQVGLFLGPLYTLYKAASAIQVAKSLSTLTGKPVVPVFWLQSEDHDLPEISRSVSPRLHGGVLDLRLPASSTDRVSVAHLTFAEELDHQLESLEDELSQLANGQEHLELIRRHYRVGAGWVEAFAGVLAELFADEGLVLVDPRDPRLARQAAPLHRRALEEASTISQALRKRVDALEEAGFSAAVHVRPDAPLSFFHPDGARGPRYRLEATESGFREIGGGGVHSLPKLLETLANEPLRFSTSALLRPIVQDTLLPTAAYVGGPGEIAYFAQLAPLYEHFGMPMPLLVPRARLRIVEPRTRRLLERLQVSPDDAARSEDELLALCATGEPNLPAPEEISARLLASFEQSFRETDASLRPSLPTLGRALDKTRATVEFAVSKLAANYAKARLRHDAGRTADVRRLQTLLHPENGPQERCFGFSYYAAKWGDRALVEAVLDAVVPFDPALKDLEP